MSAAAGGPVLLLLIIGIFFWRSGKVSTVKPWATGLSGQLQRAFITGNSLLLSPFLGVFSKIIPS